MNSFITAKCQRKLRKFLENPRSGSRVSGLIYTYQLDPGSRVLGSTFRVSRPGSHQWDGSQVLGLEFHQKSRVSGPTFQICQVYIVFFLNTLNKFS